VHHTYILVLNSLNFDTCTRSSATVLMLCGGEFWMVNLKNPYIWLPQHQSALVSVQVMCEQRNVMCRISCIS
jgi:hypothetical protein